MKRPSWMWPALAGLVVAAAVAAQAAGSLRIVTIARDDQVVVTFEVADAYNEEIRDAIASGLKTSFTYDVELRTVGAIWVDRTIASAIGTTSDQYDNLTRRHTLSRA